jgi:hypothetical protein
MLIDLVKRSKGKIINNKEIVNNIIWGNVLYDQMPELWTYK